MGRDHVPLDETCCHGARAGEGRRWHDGPVPTETSDPHPDVVRVEPLPGPLDAVVRVPGSKSITNRALLCAALADGRSTLRGCLVADDVEAMRGAVIALGARVDVEDGGETLVVTGCDPRTAARPLDVDARDSGTTSRFVLPAVALAGVRSVVDGSPQLRRRPFGPLVEALRALGSTVDDLGAPGCLPVAVTGPLQGGRAELPGHLSSQFLSGLLLAAPLMPAGLEVVLTSPAVSLPYLTMTTAVMRAFGADTPQTPIGRAGPDVFRVRAGRYRATDFDVEPDASAASYFLAAAVVAGGRVRVDGLGTASLQGDVGFADVLERMGARVERTPSSITVTSTGELRGVDVDLADISDTAQTLAAVAVHASGPTRVRGIEFIRRKETDRITAVVTELRRAGIDARETEGGFTIVPGVPRPTRFATWQDHRMAMSLALLGLRHPGIELSDPGCVAKTYPGYFDDLAALGDRGVA